MLTDIDPFWGPRPVVGDKVYVDFGDSILTGGEAIGWVKSIDDLDGIVLVDSTGAVTDDFLIEHAIHIEVMG